MAKKSLAEAQAPAQPATVHTLRGPVPKIADITKFCHACQRPTRPLVGMLPSNAFGELCAHCNAPLGPALTTSVQPHGKDGLMGEFVPLPKAGGEQESVAPRALQTGPSLIPAVDRAPRAATRRYEALATVGDDPGEVLANRLAEIEMDLARMRIETCRMRGLEVEAKHLRKELAAVRAIANRAAVVETTHHTYATTGHVLVEEKPS